MFNHRIQHLSVYALAALIALTFIFGVSSRPATAADNELVLAIQPILSEKQTRKAFQPLCDYLAKATGRPCRLFTSPNFYAYWDTVRHSTAFNLVLDAAHFTDYRATKLGYHVLAKIPDTVSYSLVTRDNDFLVDASELVGKRVATLGIPSIGAARLNGLFPNPSRQPVTIEVGAAEQAIRQLLDGKLKAAILPTPLVAQQMATGGGLYVVLATDPIPHIGLSVSPSIDAGTRSVLLKAVLTAHTSEEGKKMLKQIGFERFDPATASVYSGQAGILKEYWGY
jgi:ABC-type phosphate/phosphonate transport system substrate-binding protein